LLPIWLRLPTKSCKCHIQFAPTDAPPEKPSEKSMREDEKVAGVSQRSCPTPRDDGDLLRAALTETRRSRCRAVPQAWNFSADHVKQKINDFFLEDSIHLHLTEKEE